MYIYCSVPYRITMTCYESLSRCHRTVKRLFTFMDVMY